ncbi:hypothetical protein Amet_2125 [Alkaliphilus metalliredigens QYMF]|uniref:LITAF domain-containing protein n=1 Tax=Alkaliphilus metalliredigens (strain QYMF) TaxID=293826 RepID=A6TQ16_ALKMQ|nr:hypothetical protein [Alkaliphilus metalliredigens]ABR48284.1 hypothetical protein Amet_2125 [Alkaliphilus metalliredigens QYMF]
MKVCPECYSDNVERTSSIGARLFICIFLLFIPFGIFICWIPFVFPHRFICKVCGKDDKEEMMVAIDWRESEILLENQKTLENNLRPKFDRWFNFEDSLYKIVKARGYLLLLKVTKNNIETLLIKEYSSDTNIIKTTSSLSNKFKALKTNSAANNSMNNSGYNSSIYDSIINKMILTPIGNELITEEEFDSFKKGIDNLFHFLESNQLLIEPIEVSINQRT